MLHVYPLPPVLRNNVYLDRLYAPLANSDTITIFRARPRVALPRLLREGAGWLLHLHFFDELLQRSRLTQTLARTEMFLMALRTLQLRGVKLVWTAHNLQPHETHHPAAARFAYRTIARSADAIIAHSQSARDLLSQRYGQRERITVIPHGHYLNAYGPLCEQVASRQALGLPAEGRITLSLGTMRRYKGLEDLLTAFARLPQATRGTLLIAGAAKDRGYAAELSVLAGKIPGVIVRPGFIPDHTLPRYLGAADSVVLSYRSLLTSGVLLLALSYERPVVAPSFAPVCEIVRDEETGWLYRPNDVASLARALERSLAHPRPDELGQAGLAIARSYNWESIAQRTETLYQRVATGTAR